MIFCFKMGIKSASSYICLVYDFLNGFKDGIINSDILGCAFEPEERYENPDGTAITFDRDYLGEHRGVSTIPGPFASREASEKQIW